MWNRALLAFAALFWVCMNLLLWRSEFRPDGQPGATIPTEVVIEKILRSPDLSSMEIRQRGRRLGYARLLANQESQALTLASAEGGMPLEGEVRQLTGYSLDFDGMIQVAGETNRYRFFLTLQVRTNLAWESFTVRISHSPHSVSLAAFATNQTLNVTYKDSDFQANRQFTFDQLRNPERLAQEMGGPLLGTLVAGAYGALPAGVRDPGQAARRIQWRSSVDRLKIGEGYARVYRMETEPMDRQKVVIIVSRVGEILKVELPHGITLVNDEVRL
jgi:hypothetical protein